MSLGEKNIFGAIRAFSYSAKTKGPSTSFPLTSGSIYSSSWLDVSDYATLVGTCFVSGGAYSTASLAQAITAIGTSGSNAFYITGSDETIYTFVASYAATASAQMAITGVQSGSAYYITGSNSTIYIYSASWGATASLQETITSCSLGHTFYITGSDGTIYAFSASLPAHTASLHQAITSVPQATKFYITASDINLNQKYTYSASWYSTASLVQAITTGSNADRFYITASNGTTKYTYSASIYPIPVDDWTNRIFYFSTGSNLEGVIANLKDEINISSVSASVTASSNATELILWTKDTGSVGNLIGFQSGSTQNLFTGGANFPYTLLGQTYYFLTGSLATSLTNLVVQINNSTNSWLTASADATSLFLFTKIFNVIL